MPTLDEVLERQLRNATPPSDPRQVYREVAGRKRRRAVRRTAGRVGLAVIVVAASVVGVGYLSRGFDDDGQPATTPSSVPDPTISAQPSPTAGVSEPTPVGGRDAELGFELCAVESLRGIELGADLPTATAWTGFRRAPDGSCPDGFEDAAVLAADVDGDGTADGWTELSHCMLCRPYASTDFDADGRDELVVLLRLSSTPSYGIYELAPEGEPRAPGVYPIFVGEPGDRAGGFPVGEPMQFRAGGDEGFSAAIACDGYPEDPVLVVVWSDRPIEGPGSDLATVRTTLLRLMDDGAFHVVGASTEKQRADRPLPIEVQEEPCGVPCNDY